MTTVERLDKIRARLNSFNYAVGYTDTMPADYLGPCEDEFYEHAPDDIEFLLKHIDWLERQCNLWIARGINNHYGK